MCKTYTLAIVHKCNLYHVYIVKVETWIYTQPLILPYYFIFPYYHSPLVSFWSICKTTSYTFLISDSGSIPEKLDSSTSTSRTCSSIPPCCPCPPTYCYAPLSPFALHITQQHYCKLCLELRRLIFMQAFNMNNHYITNHTILPRHNCQHTCPTIITECCTFLIA